MDEKKYKLIIEGPYYGTLRDFIALDLTSSEMSALYIALETSTTMVRNDETANALRKGLAALAVELRKDNV